MDRAIMNITNHDIKCDCASCTKFKMCCTLISADWSDDLVKWATYHLFGAAHGQRAIEEATLRGFDVAALVAGIVDRTAIIIKVDFINRRRIA